MQCNGGSQLSGPGLWEHWGLVPCLPTETKNGAKCMYRSQYVCNMDWGCCQTQETEGTLIPGILDTIVWSVCWRGTWRTLLPVSSLIICKRLERWIFKLHWLWRAGDLMVIEHVVKLELTSAWVSALAEPIISTFLPNGWGVLYEQRKYFWSCLVGGKIEHWSSKTKDQKNEDLKAKY